MKFDDIVYRVNFAAPGYRYFGRIGGERMYYELHIITILGNYEKVNTFLTEQEAIDNSWYLYNK